MRVLGLDVGTKRIGVAVSDPLRLTAQGLTVIKKGEELTELPRIIEQMEVSEIVVGLPKNMDGSLGPKAQEILELTEKLRETLQLPVHTYDERLTTVAAERILLEADLSRAKRRQVVDKTAAVLILQGYLDSTR
ncbi:Holliday junction resolvase RuvX [Thermincola potens]|uniref:Putative pre-16S rRNA nuclease n=1 Tax=Thermincola potens (strain JR) TaxID=635013 RepID=D5X829_THEPJ|nr:Holliday junction resolvase RuvX [Thermincola potens]ADG82749.1 Holliday junction resolvase YqgF [Thermincola potens JR]